MHKVHWSVLQYFSNKIFKVQTINITNRIYDLKKNYPTGGLTDARKDYERQKLEIL